MPIRDTLATYTQRMNVEHSNTVYYSRPCSTFGYYRGNPIYDEQGYGPAIQGEGFFPAGEGATVPPVDYTLCYIVAGLGLVGLALALCCVRLV